MRPIPRALGQGMDRAVATRLAAALVLLLVCALPAHSAFAFEVGADDSADWAALSQGSTPPAAEGLQPGQAVLNPIGIALAVVFLFLMVNLFRWMFKVPPQLPYAVVKARQSVSALRCILVPTTEGVPSERAVELACRLGEKQKATILLAYIIEVPFTRSLTASGPEEQTRGQEALRTAQFVAEQYNLPVVTRVIPHRSIWGGILHLASKENVDAIVMSVGSGKGGAGETISGYAQEVVRRAPCEVILDRMPRRSAA